MRRFPASWLCIPAAVVACAAPPAPATGPAGAIEVTGPAIATRPVTLTLRVRNPGREPIRIPEPGAGTVVWDLGDGRSVAAAPGRPDPLRILGPGEEMATSITVDWPEPGEYPVTATLRPRDGSDPVLRVRRRVVVGAPPPE